MKINFVSSYQASDEALVLFLLKGESLQAEAKKIDTSLAGQLSKTIKVNKFQGNFLETFSIIAPQGIKTKRIIVVGLGDKKKFDAVTMEEIASSALKLVKESAETKATFLVDLPKAMQNNAAKIAAHMAYGVVAGNYEFKKYKTEKQKEGVAQITIVTSKVEAAKKLFAPLEALNEATMMATDWVLEPPNILYPETYVDRIKPLAKLGLKIEVLDEAQIKKLGMGALMGVAMGSEKKPYVVVLQWTGARNKKKKPIALVGKGVTFDTGGYNLKPGESMLDMKDDMTGSAIVVATLASLAKRKAKVNAVGVIGLVENMISGGAQRPSDVVTTMKGTTVEIINTDAEGRMVLADILWYTLKRFNPEQMINLATLTGAIAVALGVERAGLFSNNKKMVDRLFAVGEEYNELTWPMPLDDFYLDKLSSTIADLKHTGPRFGGAITAAKFLEQFVDKTPWVHIDVNDSVRPPRYKNTKGRVQSLFGVRLLDHYIEKHIED